MLATLYAKALDAGFEKPILGDRWAKDIVDRIDYDWSKTTITARTSPSVTTAVGALRPVGTPVSRRSSRSRSCCTWAAGWTPGTSGWHPGPDVEWYDVDYPDVADLRVQLFPPRDTATSSPHRSPTRPGLPTSPRTGPV